MEDMKPIGAETMCSIADAAGELEAMAIDCASPYQGVYRINDRGDCVTEESWNSVWSAHPSWWEKAWMLADNGQHTFSEVSAMTVSEIEEAYADPSFSPDVAFYTQADENGGF